MLQKKPKPLFLRKESQRLSMKLPVISIGATLPKESSKHPGLREHQKRVTLGPTPRAVCQASPKAVPQMSSNRTLPTLTTLNSLGDQKPFQQTESTLPLSKQSSINLELKKLKLSFDSDSEESSFQAGPKNESISSSFVTDEYYSIWDNVDLNLRGFQFDELEQHQKIQQFLMLYKMRSGGFPGQRENLANEKVIQAAANYARQSKELFKKYFPTKQVVFENDEDYSQSYDFSKDPNFKKFQSYVLQKAKKKAESDTQQL